jgi:hypothetical protein
MEVHKTTKTTEEANQASVGGKHGTAGSVADYLPLPRQEHGGRGDRRSQADGETSRLLDQIPIDIRHTLRA